MDRYTSDLVHPKFLLVSDSIFWKMMSFETKWIVYFGAKSRATFCLVCVLLQKQCAMLMRHHHSSTAQYGLRNDRIFSININSDYIPVSIPTLPVMFLTFLSKRQRG